MWHWLIHTVDEFVLIIVIATLKILRQSGTGQHIDNLLITKCWLFCSALFRKGDISGICARDKLMFSVSNGKASIAVVMKKPDKLRKNFFSNFSTEWGCFSAVVNVRCKRQKPKHVQIFTSAGLEMVQEKILVRLSWRNPQLPSATTPPPFLCVYFMSSGQNMDHELKESNELLFRTVWSSLN